MATEEDRLWDSGISRKELIEVLDQMPPGIRLVKNNVGNLAGYDDERNYIGWLDLSKPVRWNQVRSVAKTCRHGYSWSGSDSCPEQLDGATVTELHEKDRFTITGRGTVIIVEQMANREAIRGRTVDIDGTPYLVKGAESCLILGHDEGHCTCFGGTALLMASLPRDESE